METRRFGRTEIDISRLVVGAGFVGGLMVLKDADTRLETMRRALAAGINWVDTAPRYGQGKSEQHLGELLPELDVRPHLSTKVRLDVTRLDDIAGQIDRSVNESLDRLGLDKVDLIQLHNQIEEKSGSVPDSAVSVAAVLDDGGVADCLDDMRYQGLTDHIGITALGDAEPIVRVIDSGRFDTAQVYYNLLNPSAARAMPSAWQGHDFSGVLDACNRHDMGVLGIRIFAAGVLATPHRSGREVVITDDSELATESARADAVFSALGDECGTHAQCAVRFGITQEAIDGIIIGMAEPEHLDEAIAAQALGPLPSGAIARLERVYGNNFA